MCGLWLDLIQQANSLKNMRQMGKFINWMEFDNIKKQLLIS